MFPKVKINLLSILETVFLFTIKFLFVRAQTMDIFFLKKSDDQTIKLQHYQTLHFRPTSFNDFGTFKSFSANQMKTCLLNLKTTLAEVFKDFFTKPRRFYFRLPTFLLDGLGESTWVLWGLGPGPAGNCFGAHRMT